MGSGFLYVLYSKSGILGIPAAIVNTVYLSHLGGPFDLKLSTVSLSKGILTRSPIWLSSITESSNETPIVLIPFLNERQEGDSVNAASDIIHL